MINYKTKFKIGDLVIISNGLLKGKKGRITGYDPSWNQGLYMDASKNSRYENDVSLGMYTVDPGFFAPNITVLENDLELI